MFYEELKKRRRELGLTLDQVSNKTKINIKFLKAFESGNFAELPQTYVRLFLKAYAQELNMDAEQILEDYDAYRQEEPQDQNRIEQTKAPKTDQKNDKDILPKSNKKSLFGILLSFAILIFIIIILKQVLMEKQQNTTAVPISPTEIINESEPPQDTTQQASYESTQPTTPVPQEPPAEVQAISPELTLTMSTQDTCWVRLIRDEADTSEAIYPPNSQARWQTDQRFDLRLGRPAGVSLFLNGKDLGPVGNGNIPVRLIITADGIIRRSSL